MENEAVNIPEKVIERFYIYYRTLSEYQHNIISSSTLSGLTGFTPEIIRKDLNILGRLGKRGRGYSKELLKDSLKKILKIDKKWSLVLIGVGNIGKALLAYKGFPQRGFFIKLAFDKDPSKIGNRIGQIVIRDIKSLEKTLKKIPLDIAIVAVPRQEAQRVIEELVRCNIKYILNFAPLNPRKIPGVNIQNVDLSLELERLSFKIR